MPLASFYDPVIATLAFIAARIVSHGSLRQPVEAFDPIPRSNRSTLQRPQQ
jgi:hypothetical protein